VHADEKVMAFLELEAAIRAGGAIMLDEQPRFSQHSAWLTGSESVGGLSLAGFFAFSDPQPHNAT